MPLAEIVDLLVANRPLAGALAITFDDGYLDNFDEARPVLLRHGLPATFFVSTEFIGSDSVAWWDRNIQPPPRWMCWEQVTQLQRAGFDIGCHTSTHVDLGQVTGERARAEITGSLAELTERLGRAPAHFAFPYGGRDNLLEENRALIREAGFRCCVSCYGGVVRSGADPFRLQRVPVSAWFRNPEQFAFEVAFNRA